MAWLGFTFFPNSYAVTVNQTHVSSVEPLLRYLNLGRFTDSATVAKATILDTIAVVLKVRIGV